MKPFKEKKIVKIFHNLGIFLAIFTVIEMIVSIVVKQDLSIFYLTSFFTTIFLFVFAGALSNIDNYIRNLVLYYAVELKRTRNPEDIIKLRNELQNLIVKSNSKNISNNKEIRELFKAMDIKYKMLKQ